MSPVLRLAGAGVCACAALLAGCSSSSPQPTPTATTIAVPGSFSELDVADGFTVRVAPGNPTSATVSISGLPPDQVVAVVTEGVLELRTASGTVPPGATLTAAVSATSLQAIRVTAGASVVVDSGSKLTGDDVEVDLAAGAELTATVAAATLSVRMQAGSRATLTGSATKSRITAAEAATLTGAGLSVADADVEMTSGSHAELSVIDTLSVDLSSGSTLEYRGDPQITDRKVTSGAALAKMSE